MFTQPLMYKIIKKKPDVLQVYTEKLVKEGRVTQVFTTSVFTTSVFTTSVFTTSVFTTSVLTTSVFTTSVILLCCQWSVLSAYQCTTLICVTRSLIHFTKCINVLVTHINAPFCCVVSGRYIVHIHVLVLSAYQCTRT